MARFMTILQREQVECDSPQSPIPPFRLIKVRLRTLTSAGDTCPAILPLQGLWRVPKSAEAGPPAYGAVPVSLRRSTPSWI